MKMISVGLPSTLGTYRKLTEITFGKSSGPHQFILKKIKESPNGDNEEVIADESQMIYLFSSMISHEGANNG